MGQTVTVKIYPNFEDAELAHQFLLDHGIQATIEVDQVGGLQPSV